MLKELIKEILQEEFRTKPAITNAINPDGFLGKICMFRTYSAGVHFGHLVKKNGKECIVNNSYRVFYWSGACSLSQLAMDGSTDRKSCKIATPVTSIILTEVIEIIPMKEDAIKSLTGGELWKK
jgi:uncharacterized ferredoxin-like protein